MTGRSWVLRWDTDREAKPRMLVHPEAGSPSAITDSRSGSFFVIDGYLFDRAELGCLVERLDAALVASAYDRWGDALLDKLRGGFVLIVWDQEKRRLLVGRDAMGLVPCFYWWNGRTLLVARSLDAILSQPQVDRRFNRAVIAEYLENELPPRQVHDTFYEDIQRLPPAHGMSLNGRCLELSRYWDPLPSTFAWASEDEASRFPVALETAVNRCLSAGGDSLSLSGGFDSVSIAVVAAEQLRGRDPLHAVSLRFTDPSCDEGEIQRSVARTLGMPQIIRSFDECLDDDAFAGGLLRVSRVSPNPVMSVWQPMYGRLLRSAADAGLSRLLTGDGGDDMFHVGRGYAAHCLAARDLVGLWRLYRARQRTGASSAARTAWAVLWEDAAKVELRRLAGNVLDSVSPRLRDRVRRHRRSRTRQYQLIANDPELIAVLDLRRLDPAATGPASGTQSDVRGLRGLMLSPLLAMEFDQSFAWAEDAGFRLLYPFFDRDVIDLCLRMHPEHVIAGGRLKAPLRRLVAERLSSVSMPARKVSFVRMFDALFRPKAYRAWSTLGGPVMLTDLGIVERQAANSVMEDYFRGTEAHGFRAWLLLSAELWLRARSGLYESQDDRRRWHDAA